MTRVVAAEGRLLEEILDASHELWSDGLTRAAYGRYFAAQVRTPWGARNLHRVALVRGDELLASAKQYDFAARLDGDTVRVAGIGAVFTQPEARGRGHARELVERLLDRAGQEGFDLALLFSEIGPRYYERLGFVAVPASDLSLRVVEPARRGAPAVLVRGGGDRDLEHVAALGRARADSYRFHLDRDVDLIRYAIARKRLLAGLGPAGRREVEFVVAEEGLMAVAYAVVSVDCGGPGRAGPRWVIEECGDRDPAGARVGAILQTLVAREPSAQRPAITAWLPSGFLPPQATVVDRRPSSELMMLRGLRRPAPALHPAEVLYWRSDLF